MQAGRLDRRVTFQRRATTPDGYGNERAAWVDHLTVWAGLKIADPRERGDGEVMRANTAGRLMFRASAASRAITGADRVMIGGAAWRLLGDPVEEPHRSGQMVASVEREG